MKITSFKEIPKFIQQGSYSVDYPLNSLVKWVRDEQDEMNLQLEPDFQRGHVWTEEQQKKYVQFLLRGGRTGRDLYFNCPSWHVSVPEGAYDEFVCVDGLQRITAITRFINNEIPVFGSYFKEFTDSIRLLNCTMRVNVNNLRTKRAVLQWYIEMNAGGTPHSEEEIERVKALMESCS